MSTILTETSTFTPTVTAPDDGDPATGASVTTGLQSLTNRTRYHKDTIDALVAGVSGSAVIASGAWVPTVTAGSGMTGSASNVAGQYLRVGDIVFFSLYFEMDEDGTDNGGVNDRYALITLPVARSDFASNQEATGTVSGFVAATDLKSTGGHLRALAGDDRLIAGVYNTSAASDEIVWYCTGSYTLA